MEGSPRDLTDAEFLPTRASELEDELRLRMDEVTRLHRELQHLRDDAAVKDEYIAVLSAEADKLQRARDLMAQLPLGSRLARSLGGQLGAGPGVSPPLAARARTASSLQARRARALAGRVKRRLLQRPHPDI